MLAQSRVLASSTLIAALLPAMLSAQSATFHLSFDDESYLEHDYSHRMGFQSGLDHEIRQHELVDGVFGKALLNGRRYIQEDFEQTHMSVRSLDVLLTVIVHHRFKYYEQGLEFGWMQPYFWGTGRLSTQSGTVAFWAKGERVPPGHLFFQSSSSFGRFETDLMGIDLLEDGSLEAWLVDARYDRHSIRSQPTWDSETFNHVALSWDHGHGLTLYLNGEEVASNWGETAWWTTQIPGLFHMPMSGFAFDELWIFDQPLEQDQVRHLMTENEPPPQPSPQVHDDAAVDRLANAFVGPGRESLPVLSAGSTHRFQEIYPSHAGDGVVRSSYVMDGKYALAWPQDYTSFTNILGDSDFHPEKVDIFLPEGPSPNYVSITGNLSDVRLMEGSEGLNHFEQRLAVPGGRQFFHAQDFEATKGRLFQIPFLKGYGSPEGYAEGLHMALSGDMRVHDVSFYHRDKVEPELPNPETFSRMSIQPAVSEPLSHRYDYAWRTMRDGKSDALLGLDENDPGAPEWHVLPPMTRTSMISAPVADDSALKSLFFDLHLRGVKDGSFMTIRVMDPGVPARLWNKLVYRLEGFEGQGDRLRLHLDLLDIRMPAGDRVLLDITFESGAEILVGSPQGSAIALEKGRMTEASPAYAHKTIQPALSDFAKIYYWYYPWVWAGDEPDPENPVTFGGYYNIMNHTLNAMRTVPNHPYVSALYHLSLFDKDIDPDRVFPAWENNPDFWPALRIEPSGGAPDWAVYMRHYLAGLREVVEWWAERQNPDGQVGGGLNDDVMFASRLPGPLLYMEGSSSRRMFDRIFDGLDHSRMFHDGFCNIVPMDDIHAIDLVRYRFEGLLFRPGDPHATTRALRTAWRLGKPEETPINYHDGRPFQYEHDTMKWFWGEAPEHDSYTVDVDRVTDVVSTYAPAINDVLFFRYTASGMYTDGFNYPGGAQIRELVIGGNPGPFLEDLTISANWEDGPGVEMPRWVEYASNTRFVANLYSFSPEKTEATVRLLRLNPGTYRITLEGTGESAGAGVIHTESRKLGRLSTVTFPVYPSMELRLSVEVEGQAEEPLPLPDLAIGTVWRSGTRLNVEALNLGNASADNVEVRLLDDAGRTISTRTIPTLPSAGDFVPGQEMIDFSVLGLNSASFTVIIDPEGDHEEIMDNNNSKTVVF